MLYTVQETADISGTTIKTLYHYHKLGLLVPGQISEKGYRLYGEKELKRLQEILFYRELDLPLNKIKEALDGQKDRLACLKEQRDMLIERKYRFSNILLTLESTLSCEEKGVEMSSINMFKGFDKEEWEDAAALQNEHLEKEYGYSVSLGGIDADDMRKKADEAAAFINFMADALKSGVRIDDLSVKTAIQKHISFLNHDLPLDSEGFYQQSRFFMNDDFHRNMLEARQIGLSYYLCAAAESFTLS